MRRALALIIAVVGLVPFSVQAHQLSVFASVDCDGVLVEAKFSSGKRPVKGELRVLDGARVLLQSLPLESNGTARVALDSVDHAGGLIMEVHTGGGHDDYWIVTPEDIESGCER